MSDHYIIVRERDDKFINHFLKRIYESIDQYGEKIRAPIIAMPCNGEYVNISLRPQRFTYSEEPVGFIWILDYSDERRTFITELDLRAASWIDRKNWPFPQIWMGSEEDIRKAKKLQPNLVYFSNPKLALEYLVSKIRPSSVEATVYSTETETLKQYKEIATFSIMAKL